MLPREPKAKRRARRSSLNFFISAFVVHSNQSFADHAADAETFAVEFVVVEGSSEVAAGTVVVAVVAAVAFAFEVVLGTVVVALALASPQWKQSFLDSRVAS